MESHGSITVVISLCAQDGGAKSFENPTAWQEWLRSGREHKRTRQANRVNSLRARTFEFDSWTYRPAVHGITIKVKKTALLDK